MTIEANKRILETVEWFLSSILSVCSSAGMFLIGYFACNLLSVEVSTVGMVVIFVVSMALTWIVEQVRLNVWCWKLEILADEAEMQKAEDDELLEHLTRGL